MYTAACSGGWVKCCFVCFCSKSLGLYLCLSFVKTTSFQNLVRSESQRTQISVALCLLSKISRFAFEVKRTLNTLAICYLRGASVCRCLQVLDQGQGKQAGEHIVSGGGAHCKCTIEKPLRIFFLTNTSWLRTGDVFVL